MKTRFLILPLAISAIAMAAQDGFKNIRAWKEGEKDVTNMTMKMTTGMGEMTISMTNTQTTKKVYENGDADVETLISNMKMNMMGSDREMPSSPATTTKYNKFGAPVAVAGTAARGMNFNFLDRARSFGDAELKLNVPYNIDWTDPKEPKSKVKGTATLIELTDTKATVKSDINVWTPESGTDSIHMISTSTVDRATGKSDKFEATVDKMPAALTQGFQIDKMVISATRKIG